MSRGTRAPGLAAIRPSGTFAHILAGALAGGAVRAAADLACMRAGIAPAYPTLAVNALGCAVAGWAFRWIHAFDAQGTPVHSSLAARVRERAVIGGFCGSLTTMSAVATMAAAQAPLAAALAMAMHAGAGVASACVGWWVGARFPRRSPEWRR